MGLAACAAACVAGAASADGVKVGYSSKGEHYSPASKVLVGAAAEGDDFRVVHVGTNRCDTAWYMPSNKAAVPAGSGVFAFDFEIYADRDWMPPVPTDTWRCHLTWYDANDAVMKAKAWIDTLGVQHETEQFDCIFKKGNYEKFRIVGEVPEGATAVTIGFGTDGPNVNPGEKVAVRNTHFTTWPKGAPLPMPVSPDLYGPSLKAKFASPCEDPALEVRYAFVDQSEIDWSSVTVKAVDGKERVSFERDGNDIVLKPAGGAWAAGDHHFRITAKDVIGNGSSYCKAFRIGRKPDVPEYTLRKDGTVLVGGKPFFPIGMFAVCPREANLYSLDRAFLDLSAAGVNVIHTYSSQKEPEFLGCLGKYGLKAFFMEYEAPNGSKWFEETARQCPDVMAWQIGDDTARVTTPETFANRAEALRALDGRRLLCHADGYTANFRRFVRGADVFMPEIYPIRHNEEDLHCVETVIDVVEKSLADIRLYSPDKPCAVWPLIQHFKGYGTWQYPSAQELYAMSFAGLIHGGKGITWYTYGGFVRPEKKQYNYGVTATKEAWCAMTNVTRRLSQLAPVFLAEDVPQPPAPAILEGPAKDVGGRTSVTMLLKKLDGATYVLAVNATRRDVKARLSAGGAQGEAEVLWEGRKIPLANGCIEDSFAPLDVHIYKIAR